ncbi:MAG TPA: iron-containing alcohol dehydrogenase, partial [Mycobacterium sp.]|nr:iron-containing alcohol dehydrogenase [Mycobacterium sp.]
MTAAINIALPRFAKFGAGAIDDLGSVVAQLGIARPVLVTDQYLTETGQTERLVKILQAAGSEPAVFAETVPDPTVASLEDGLALVRTHGADGIIGFGGGSPMDTAKAL